MKLNLSETAVTAWIHLFHHITTPQIYGHLISTTPLPQHWHETKASGEAPIRGQSELIITHTVPQKRDCGLMIDYTWSSCLPILLQPITSGFNGITNSLQQRQWRFWYICATSFSLEAVILPAQKTNQFLFLLSDNMFSFQTTQCHFRT